MRAPALPPPLLLLVMMMMMMMVPPPTPAAETFSAMRSVRQARGAEGRLLTLLGAYLQREGRRLGRLARFYDRVRALHREPPASLDNPLLAFGLIKRLRSDWPNVLYSEGASENTQELQGGFEALRAELPGPRDLEGAARALLRLQDVYALSVRALAKGAFEGTHGPLYRPGQPVGLSADDCFHVGKVAYDMGDHHHSIAWLEEAVDLFRLSYGSWNEEDRASLEDALDHLAFSYFMVGNISHALSLSRELLRYDPDNARVSRNVVQYEKLLEERGPAEPRRPRSRPHGAYEELCRGTRGPPWPPAPGLHCTYHTNGSPLLLLQPAKRETLGLRPFVALYHDFVSDAEAEAIKALAGPRLQRSVVASGEQQQAAEYRISKSAWLKDTADPAVAALERRIAAVTGLDVRAPYAEYLQVVNYGLGGHYEPHFDHATSRKSPLYRMNSGNRIATVMVYLSSVEAGGSTAFIHANVSVPVVKNAALFWWNLRRSGKGDGATLHGACPVLAGDKWVANKWIHEHGQEFRRPCGRRAED